MKTINNFIVEHLKYSTSSINEKLKISSKSNFYTCQPKDKFELRKILEERLAKDKNADLNNIDVSEITDMGYKGFKDDKGLFEDLDPHNIDISEWNVSNVTNMWCMFYNCENFNTDLSNWDVSKVEDMRAMFNGCNKFTGKGLENWKTFNAKGMAYMFYKCYNFDSDLSKWDMSNVEDTRYMFWGCKKFSCNLNNWKMPKLKYMSFMLFNCDSLKNIPSWYKK